MGFSIGFTSPNRRLKCAILACPALFLVCLVFVLQLFTLYFLGILDNCNTLQKASVIIQNLILLLNL